mmetsp:Transcript_14934/g.40040  ORF Transcript_14934/g.40040 Transcript_14934/m.40040 type:complete len:83 (+) Transcript_14934:40-288(+)
MLQWTSYILRASRNRASGEPVYAGVDIRSVTLALRTARSARSEEHEPRHPAIIAINIVLCAALELSAFALETALAMDNATNL